MVNPAQPAELSDRTISADWRRAKPSGQTISSQVPLYLAFTVYNAPAEVVAVRGTL
jgi:hypothetical protein